MVNPLSHKLYLAIFGLMLPIPPIISRSGSKKGEAGAKANADRLSGVERLIHHFIVMKAAAAKEPITADLIADELGLKIDQVLEVLSKFEMLKTFIYRDDGNGINWAYPLSIENTGHKITASSGEQFFAA